MSRTGLITAALVSALVSAWALAGCGATPGPASPSPSPTRTSTAPAPAPRAGACYRLSVSQAISATSTVPPVPCSSRHTAQTVYVGTVDPLQDGHLLGFDASRVADQVAGTCRRTVLARLGGDQESRRLTRLQPIWFTPPPDQVRAGAHWFRCDLVLLTGSRRIGALPARIQGLLDRAADRDRYATCGTSAPGTATFERVTCSQRHSWRARASIDLPPGTRFLGRAAAAEGDARCHDIEAGLAVDSLHLRWSFEWPTRQQWDAGQRYGYCWTPDPA